jgi:fucose permease
MTVCSAASSFMAGAIVKRLGTGVVVATSCLMTALALLGFSYAPAFGWLVFLGIPLGLGAGAVDASLNHFVSAHYSSRHMNWLHGFWGIGATTGPLVMGVALASTAGWAGGARTIGLMQLTLAVGLWLSLSLWNYETSKPAPEDSAEHPGTGFKPVNRFATWLAPCTFLLYVSAEQGTGLWAASILVGSRGVALVDAGLWVSLYFGSITAGRFAVGLVANRIGNRRLVLLGLSTAACGATLFAIPALPAPLSLAGLMLMGLGCAPVFPCLMHETSQRFPDEVARAVVGRQMGFSYAGGSVMPAACGLLASYAGLGVVMPVVVGLLLVLIVLTQWLNRLT